MDSIIINDIEVDIDIKKISQKLRIDKGGNSVAIRFERLVDEAWRIARPKGFYKPVIFEIEGDDVIKIDDVRLTSRVLVVHLAEIKRVFPFVATCGKEVADWAEKKANIMERFWLETILDEILQRAIIQTSKQVVANHALKKTAIMTPGSIDDWPIEEQKILFTILGETTTSIGVTLLDSCVMSPRQSVSGILFSTEVDFQTCALCPHRKCPKRRAPYDPTMYDRKYLKK